MAHRAGVWSDHLLEISMSLNLASTNIANAAATRASLSRGQVSAADGYYFGYWFSHKRA